MITFESIHIEGFGSIVEPFSYNLNKTGLNIIRGKNGDGKSTIINALFWCIYGKNLKDKASIETWPHLQPEKYRGASVEVRYNIDGVGRRVERSTKGKGKLEFFRRDVKVTNYKTKPELQSIIEKDLGMSMKLAKNSIIFGQRLTRLMSESGTEQNKIFDEAFEVEFINQIKTQAEQNLIKINTELSKIEPKVEVLKYKYKTLKNSLKETKASIKVFKEQQANKIEYLENEIEELQQKTKEAERAEDRYERISYKKIPLEVKKEKLEKKLSNLIDLEKKEFRLKMEIDQTEGSVSDINYLIKNLKNDYLQPKKICPECGQPIKAHTKEHKSLTKEKINKASKEKDSISKELESLKNRHKKLLSSISKLESKKESLDRINKRLDSLDSKLSELPVKGIDYKPTIERLKKDIEKTKAEKCIISTKKIKEELLQVKTELKPKNKELKTLTKDKDLHKWLISQPLSNKGLKAYIFNNMLNLVNQRLDFYSQYIGFKTEFMKDMESGNKTLNALVIKGDNIVMYNDLSGGQTQLVDLGIAFSIHDVVSSNVDCNILFMDEVFEGLDKENIQVVNELINLKTSKYSVHLITHNDEFNYQNSHITEVKLSSKGWTCKV